MKDNKFVVYAHYTIDTNELFYVGEGRYNRAFSKWSRNKYWNNKVRKHKGFKTVILYSNIGKTEAENIETRLIRNLKRRNVNLVNFCIGPMFKNHWLLNAPKEQHPMWGKKIPNASKRIIEWNKQHSGINSPTYGLKRPDLVARNKSNVKKVYCRELNQVFDSIAAFSKHINKKFCSNRVLKKKHAVNGYHLEYFNSEASEVSTATEEVQNIKAA